MSTYPAHLGSQRRYFEGTLPLGVPSRLPTPCVGWVVRYVMWW